MRLLSVMMTAAVLAAGMGAAHADNSQQDKMKTCNADAKTKGLKGDDRKTYMKSCLSAAGATADTGKKLTPQQQKMKTCNADAKTKGLKGDDRKAYMKTCLSGSAG